MVSFSMYFESKTLYEDLLLNLLKIPVLDTAYPLYGCSFFKYFKSKSLQHPSKIDRSVIVLWMGFQN